MVMRALLLVCAVVVVSHAKLIVHPTHNHIDEAIHKAAHLPASTLKSKVHNAPTMYHKSAVVVDVTKELFELPEQTLPKRVVPRDLEVVSNDPINFLDELPEQTLVQSPSDEVPTAPKETKVHHHHSPPAIGKHHTKAPEATHQHEHKVSRASSSSDDLTSHVVELAEQNLPVRKATKTRDLELDQDDPVNHIIELPEQSLPTASSPPRDLEVVDMVKANVATEMDHSLPDTEEISDAHIQAMTAKQQQAHTKPHMSAHYRDVEDRAGEDLEVGRGDPDNGGLEVGGDIDDGGARRRGRVNSGGFQKIEGPSTFHNPLGDDPRPPVQDSRTFRAGYQAGHSQPYIDMKAGAYDVEIEHAQNTNFLDSNKVQIGTSFLGRRESGHDKVARYRIKFPHSFEHRPIVIVTTVPESAEEVDSLGVHQDVFVASVSHIKLDEFIVNVVRVDSLPVNGWGQQLYLDWVAMEYDSDYPSASP